MTAMSLFMNLYENCNNVIRVKSDEENFSENQISIYLFMTDGQFY